MAFKLKLPSNLVPGRASPGPGESVALKMPKPRRKITWRQLQKGLAWTAGLFAVFVVFAWVNMPTKAIAWRLSQEAKKAGMIVDIEDVWISPFGRVSLYDVTWSFPPSRIDEAPVPFVAERVDLRVAPIRLLFGNVNASVVAYLDEGHIEGSFARRSAETEVHLEITELPLYAVPKFQQALGAPVRGEFAMNVDLTAPENHFEDATGSIEITCLECSMGDGATKLYVPGAKQGGMLAKGMTVPEIDFGELHGTFAITDGIAQAEEFVSVSDDITIQVSGDIKLHDPFGDSEFGMIIKVFVSEQLQQSSPEINLMVATSGKTQKLKDEDLIEGQTAGLGYKLMGTVRRPKLKGIYSKSRAQRLAEARERRREAEERRKKREADRKQKEAERKAEAAAKAAEAKTAEATDDGDENPDGGAALPQVTTATAAPAVIPEAGAGEQPPPPPPARIGEAVEATDATDENGEENSDGEQDPEGEDNADNSDNTDGGGEAEGDGEEKSDDGDQSDDEDAIQ